MLTDAQLYHFAAHGWVLQENVFGSEEVEAFKDALNGLYNAKVSTIVHMDTEEIKNIDNMVNYDQIFREWILHPKILPVLKRLWSTPPRFECCHALFKLPHPDRETRYDELRDSSNMGWHRASDRNTVSFQRTTIPISTRRFSTMRRIWPTLTLRMLGL